MIPILYRATEIEFNSNGIGFLKDTIECIVTSEANGLYELELIYPIGSFLFEEIKKQRIIKAKANNIHDPQLFRIYYISKPLQGKIKIKAEHISYDNRKNFVEKLEYIGNCIGALNALNNAAAYESGFNFNSDILMTAAYNVNKKNILSAIAGTKGSIIDTYGNGPDIVRDNFNISVLVNGGNDNDVLIAYRKNLKGFNCDEDDTDVITQIYPYAVKDEVEIILPEKYIYSEYISNYPKPIIVPVDFSQEEVSNVEELRAKARNYFKSTKKDIPKLTYKLEFEELSKTINYKNKFARAENVNLYDNVIVRHEVYNLDVKVKVIKQVYDVIREKNIRLELGQPKTNLRDTLNDNINNSIEEFNKDKVTTGFLDKAIKSLSDAITGNDGGYVRLNPPENPSELLILDNEDINLAKTVWRANKEGLGVSLNGYNGSYLGLTKNGKLVVNEATANKISALLIEGGLLKSFNNSTWINMEDGTFNFANKIKFDGNNFEIDLSGKDLATNSSVDNKLSTKVSNNEFSTKIEQNAYAVKIAWNRISNYIQFENGGLSIYNGALNTSEKRAVFDERGNHFWRDGYYLGKIGTNQYINDYSIKGIVFDLEAKGGYMTWSVKKQSTDSSYSMMWSYANKTIGNYSAGKLHAGCDIDMHNYCLRNVNFEGGGITGTMNFVQIVSINTNGTAARWFNNSKLVFQNGILIDGTWGNV